MHFDFLVCSERSGSNLITKLLNAHPDIFLSFEALVHDAENTLKSACEFLECEYDRTMTDKEIEVYSCWGAAIARIESRELYR